jgi:outer membrane protein assembly factor BamB
LTRQHTTRSGSLCALAALSLVAGQMAAAGPASAQGLTFVKVWSQTVSDGSPISVSSPNVAVLDGASAVVVGDQGGQINAFSLASGAVVPGWPASTGGVPVESTPSVAALSSRSPDDSVFVGAGSAGVPHDGGYEAFSPDGKELWYVSVHSPGTTEQSGVVASLAVGDLQGSTDVVGPSLGQNQDAINAATGAVLPGFPWFQADSDLATPALADLYGTGKTDIIEGGGQTAGLAYRVHYPQGGHVRVVAATGNTGTNSPAGGLICDYHPLQSVESSPAVGRFLADSAEGLVVGTGDFWPGNPPGTDSVLAVNSHCHLVWSIKLDGATNSSPALADLLGNGTLEVVEGTNNQHGEGSVYALNGANGTVLWRQNAPGEVIGSVVTANLGAGYQDVIVAGTGGAQVLDGLTGQVIATLEKYVGLQNSALVTDDPNGSIGITVAGYNAHDIGTVEHFQLSGSQGSSVDRLGAWPMFHHDPRLSGNAEAPI